MESHPRGPSPTQSEYQDAIGFYRKVRDENTLHEAHEIGGRPFVVVQKVTETLRSTRSEHHNEHGQISRLLEAAYRRHEHKPPFNEPGQVVACAPIFYTLLDIDHGNEIHTFVEESIDKLPVERARLNTLFPKDKYDDLAARFHEQQWRWCAMQFEWKMSHRVHVHEQIVPIVARKQIEPARDTLPKTDRKAALWVVEVPACFVGPRLGEWLRENNDESDDGKQQQAQPPCVSYAPRLPLACDVTQGLTLDPKRHRFVVKQFSEKRRDEFDREKEIFITIGDSHNIIQYLGWYMHCEKDPDSGAILNFYNIVLELGDQDLYSAFQKENPPLTFPEIEAFWQSMFNVADALASIHVMDHDLYPTTYVWHGDIKPENILDVRGKFVLADPGEAQVFHAPKGQIGLRRTVPGGTRSFAAPEKLTYSPDRPTEPEVTQGSDIWSLGCVFSVAATYVVLGKEGVKQYRLLRQKAIENLGFGIGDPFHDKEKVLSVVTDWHQYLRATVRKYDCFTAKVLDIVDGHMLIVPGEDRITGAALRGELQAIDDDTVQPATAFPMDIAEFIDQVTRRNEGGESALEDVPRTLSQSGTELFTERLLYPSRRSEGRPISRQTRTEDNFLGIDSGRDPGPSMTIPERVSGFFTPQQRAMRAMLDSLPLITTARNPLPEVPELRYEHLEDPPITFWEVESVYGKSLGGKEDELEKHFKNRDLLFLVDNASSMRSFWNHASYLLRILVWRSLGYDDNGMELRFTTGPEELKLAPKKGQKIRDFEKKLAKANPTQVKSDEKTDMSASLSLILEDHIRQNSDGSKMKRHLTILVLTDGLWERNDEFDVDGYLVNFIKKIPEVDWNLDGLQRADSKGERQASRARPISIQFIRFGHHPKAIARLDRLDNQLKDRPELVGKSIPDVIDTESADGDVYKMFLGSFLDDFDNKTIRGAAVVSNTSGPSAASPNNEYAMGTTTFQPGHTPTTTTSSGLRDTYGHSTPSGGPSSRAQTHSLPLNTRVPRTPAESELDECGWTTNGHHHRHGSSESAQNSRLSGGLGSPMRPRGASYGQEGLLSTPPSQSRPFGQFG
ncbi:Uu.00g135720.m01.CDS01 [Anthostomella pinea]|uniref:Uu.00g135720.m01.CDS01 n=1 Tax=Anthostomella pinea TaxID=933095 RepID=A0AAI8VQD5_9PEZI|nr:Uu.00g135720.m01.CDS01 [Anthostomella pinea]